MVSEYADSRLSDEERREFLKVLGVAGAAAAGSATLDDIREAVSNESAEELAPVGQAITSDLAGEFDMGTLASGQTVFAETAASLPTVVEDGVPVNEAAPRDDFTRVAEAGRPVYDHLAEIGFFESTTEHLPAFTPAYIESSVRRFVTGEELARPIEELGFSSREAVDLLATVVTHREQIGDRHWVSTDRFTREEMEAVAEHVPSMTAGAVEGVLLWLEALDEHLWKNAVLVSDEILADAVWDTRAMAAGFSLMVEGASHVARGGDAIADDALAALLTSGFALQTIAQNLLARDAFWITDERRAPRGSTDIALGGD